MPVLVDGKHNKVYEILSKRLDVFTNDSVIQIMTLKPLRLENVKTLIWCHLYVAPSEFAINFKVY